jgi:hypothetical protein
MWTHVPICHASSLCFHSYLCSFLSLLYFIVFFSFLPPIVPHLSSQATMGTPLLDPPACFSGELPGQYNLLSNASPSILLPSHLISTLFPAERCKGRMRRCCAQPPSLQTANSGDTDDATSSTGCYNRHHAVLQPAPLGAETGCSTPELRRHAAVF